MALINCPECNKEISDSVKKCPNCGYKIKKQKGKDRRNGNNEEAKRKKIFKTKKQKRIAVVISSCLFAIIIGVAIFFTYNYYFIPLGQYNTAEKLVEQKKYDEAIKEYEKLGDFKDSADKITETHYKKGENLFNEKKYQEALTELEKAKTYKKTEELLRETKYTWAQSTDDMERAIQFYTELGDYKESKSKLEEAKAKKRKRSHWKN